MNILVTGCAGFIGFHFCYNLLSKFKKTKIYGIDNFNNYYDIKLKKNRAHFLKKKFNSRIIISKVDLLEKKKLEQIFKKNKIKRVVHLAAQAGIRYSIKNPTKYIQSNIVGFHNIIALSAKYKVNQLIYASSSSVYGGLKNKKLKENLNINDPIQLYAATKISNEMIANAYYKLYKIPIVGLRFFTVYGPWGRPDMALFKFTKNILKNKPIDVFNHGKHTRDFTYIDDIVEGIIKTLDSSFKGNFKWNGKKPDPATSKAPWRIFNIGNNSPVKLMDYIKALEKALGKKAKINFLPLQPGDVQDTYANVDNLKVKFKYKPSTSVSEGVSNFVEWYKNFYLR